MCHVFEMGQSATRAQYSRTGPCREQLRAGGSVDGELGRGQEESETGQAEGRDRGHGGGGVMMCADLLTTHMSGVRPC